MPVFRWDECIYARASNKKKIEIKFQIKSFDRITQITSKEVMSLFNTLTTKSFTRQ